MTSIAETDSETADPTWLYRVFGEADLLLYIGISDDFGRRWKQHAKEQPWWGEMRRLSADFLYDSRDEARAAESAAIKAEKPKHNKEKPKQNNRAAKHSKAHTAAAPQEAQKDRDLTPCGQVPAFQSGDQVEIIKPGWKWTPVVTVHGSAMTTKGHYHYHTDGCSDPHMMYIFHAEDLRLISGRGDSTRIREAEEAEASISSLGVAR